MTIDEIIKSFDYIKHVGNGESTYEHCREEIALNEAIDTMRKYQKIMQIVSDFREYQKGISCGFGGEVYMRMVSEVVEDGKTDRC